MLKIERQREERERLSREQIRAFLEATDEVQFEGAKRGEVYAWIGGMLGEQEYWKQSKQTKGLLRLYAQKMTGLSRAQTTRLIAAYVATGAVKNGAIGGTALHSDTPRPIPRCWRKWMRRMKP